MSRKVYEEPAFPTHGTMGEVVNEGMSLRDYMAAKAMAAIAHRIDLGESDRGYSVGTGARLAYGIADAMLKARAA